MKFKKFKQALKKIYIQLPETEEFPSDNALRTIFKSRRKNFLIVAAKSVTAYLAFTKITDNESEVSDEGDEFDNPDTLISSTDEILAERGKTYGKFTNHADLSQKLKVTFDTHVREYGNPELFTNSMNEAIEMILHKLARIGNGSPTYIDSWADIGGYSELIVKELNGESI